MKNCLDWATTSAFRLRAAACDKINWAGPAFNDDISKTQGIRTADANDNSLPTGNPPA
jgi:hypothetical protein